VLISITDRIGSAVVRGMISDHNPPPKPEATSGAKFQVGNDPITAEVLRSMKQNQNRVRHVEDPDDGRHSSLLMCK
jgi:hypothetical protein